MEYNSMKPAKFLRTVCQNQFKWLAFLFWLFCLNIPIFASAATPDEWAAVTCNCDWDCVSKDATKTDPLFPPVFFSKNAPLTQSGHWAQAVENLKDLFQDETGKIQDETSDGGNKKKFLAQMALLESELSSVENSKDRQNLEANAAGVTARVFWSEQDGKIFDASLDNRGNPLH